ncbi:MAG: hypothetical protein WC614_10890 [bacterium]
MENSTLHNDSDNEQQTLEKLIVKAVYRKYQKQGQRQDAKKHAVEKEADKTDAPVAVGSEV